jgi:hypothetical protein
VAEPFISRVEEPATDSAVKANLPHKHKQWNYGERIRRENVKYVGGNHTQRSLWRNDKSEANSADSSHNKSDRHTAKQHYNQKNTSANANL